MPTALLTATATAFVTKAYAGVGTLRPSVTVTDVKVGDASVICGNVQTANATVYIIDGVLLPAS